MIYKDAICEIYKEIGSGKEMVLATCINNQVSARLVCVIVLNGKFYFQSDTTMNKAKEIKMNSNVALCYKGIQVKGSCKEKSHPLKDENTLFANVYKEFYSESFRKYTGMDNERIFEITPTYAEIWVQNADQICIRYCDFRNQTCYEKSYN